MLGISRHSIPEFPMTRSKLSHPNALAAQISGHQGARGGRNHSKPMITFLIYILAEQQDDEEEGSDKDEEVQGDGALKGQRLGQGQEVGNPVRQKGASAGQKRGKK
mmetsp:Transcript_26567/g.41649  ORF Transcript_26567/g.41649 Transcript_26567/m.41649 type:complete len:106 (+) Transcript_26567:481-798(+)